MASHAAHRAPVRRPVRVATGVAQALILALVVAATSAFALAHKSVTVRVDGRAQPVEGYARTVGDLLAAAHVPVGAHDLVVPALDQPVSGDVVVQHAAAVQVEVDGTRSTVWTTATDVGQVVADLGLQPDAVRTSAPSTDPVSATAVLRVSTTKTVHVAVDGQTIDAVTDAGTVRDALKDVGLVLQDGDQVSVPLGATAVDGLVVVVTRAASTGDSSTEAVPYDTQQVDDATMLAGTTKVVTAGKAGMRTTTYQVQTVGGAVVSRTPVASVVSVAPVTEVVHVGTLQAPAVGTVDPGSAQAVAQAMLPGYGWDDTQFACLVSLWDHESGWRVDASNSSSGAYGIPQALPGSKMGSVAADWRTNPATQITWGLGYIQGRYGSPCAAWAHLESSNWY